MQRQKWKRISSGSNCLLCDEIFNKFVSVTSSIKALPAMSAIIALSALFREVKVLDLVIIEWCRWRHETTMFCWKPAGVCFCGEAPQHDYSCKLWCAVSEWQPGRTQRSSGLHWLPSAKNRWSFSGPQPILLSALSPHMVMVSSGWRDEVSSGNYALVHFSIWQNSSEC